MTPDEPLNERSFYTKPAWKKFIVISAGAVFNFLLAIVLFFGLNATVGNLTYTNDPVIGNIIPGSAAEQAHLQSNDRILTIDGKKSLHGMKSVLAYKVLPIMVLLLL